MEKTKVESSDFLYLGLYSFAGFGLEIILAMLLPNIIGAPSSEYTMFHHCLHWTLTCILWGSMAFFLMNLSKKRYSFDVMKFNEAPNTVQWLLAILTSAIAITVTTVVWGGFKPIQEYDGMVKLIFQNIYYLFETALIVLTIVFGQRFGEMLTKREKLPYGGLFLAFTWGLIHIFTQGFQVGVYAFIMSILYGIVYLLMKKNLKYSYVIITIIFIL